MRGKIITHEDGSESFISDGDNDIEIIKNKENPEKVKTRKVNIKNIKKLKLKKKKSKD